MIVLGAEPANHPTVPANGLRALRERSRDDPLSRLAAARDRQGKAPAFLAFSDADRLFRGARGYTNEPYCPPSSGTRQPCASP